MSRTPVPDGNLSADALWAVGWVVGIVVCGVWNAAFLNTPAFFMLAAAFVNSLAAGAVAVAGAFVLGWAAGVGLDRLHTRRHTSAALALTFVMDLVRSVPQILGLLGGYILLTQLQASGVVIGSSGQLLFMAG